MNYVEYMSNNSGGHWWLTDQQWKALEKAGWIVAWASLEYAYTPKGEHERNKDGTPKLIPVGSRPSEFGSFAKKDGRGKYRYLGALAKTAFRVGLNLRDAAAEWERVTKLDSTDAGCPCCGQPHNFTEYTKSGEYVASGPSAQYVAKW